MKATLLGTGTSQGVPVIGCQCEVCLSGDPKDKRLRTSALISDGTTNILIDCGPDLRQQMLRNQVSHLNAILITHEHNDHIIGLDEIRPFNFIQKGVMPIYATDRVKSELHQRFAYAFDPNPYPGAPRAKIESIEANNEFEIGNIKILPILASHGVMPVMGFRFGAFSYLTDVKYIDDDQIELLKGSKYVVINALRKETHQAHLNLSEALALIDKIQPEMAFLTHVSHHLGLAAELNVVLPSNVKLGFDMQEIYW